jgi:hypothetical protein
MKMTPNSFRAIGICMAFPVISYLLIVCQVPIEFNFESNVEHLVMISLIVLYVASGFFFLNPNGKIFLSLRPLLIWFVIVSAVFSSVSDITLVFLGFINPIGFWLERSSPFVIGYKLLDYAVVGVIPPLLLYLGLKLRVLFNKFHPAKKEV